MNRTALACLLLSFSMVFSGCLGYGEDDDTEDIVDEPEKSTGDPGDWDVFSIASVTSLPPCDNTTFGRLYYVEADENFQVCRTNGWEVIDIGSEGDINDSGNSAPLVTAGHALWFHDYYYTEDNGTNPMRYVYVSWSAIDVDGTISSAGFDLDLDMVIDVPVSADSGTLIDTPADSAYPGALSMPLNQGWTFERRVYEDDGQIYCSLLMHRTVAFIAEDDDGATSTELLHLVDYFVAGYVDNDFMAILNAPQADVDWIMGVTSSCPETNLDESYPFAQFASTKSSNGEYYVTVVMVSINHDLEAFNYFLKDQSGSTIEFGEIAMQNLTGQPMGIDASYGNKCGGSDQPACDSDLSDLSDAVDGDDGSTYVVAFYDNDRDGKLSAGDKFTVRGNHGSGANGPAEDDWSIEVSFDNTGDVIGSKRLD